MFKSTNKAQLTLHGLLIQVTNPLIKTANVLIARSEQISYGYISFRIIATNTQNFINNIIILETIIKKPIFNTTKEPTMLKAVILDDEPRGSTLLDHKLKQFPEEITVSAIYNDPTIALSNIAEIKPDVLFLDVEMPGMNGFQFLERLSGFNFEVIFTTAYDTYTLEALRLSAVDYLLKPIDEEDLQKAISRLKKRVSEKNTVLRKEPNIAATRSRLALSTSEGVHLIEKTNIIRIEAMSNYCTFYMTDNKKVVVSKTLKEFEALLIANATFIRINRSVIINMEYVIRYRRGSGGTVEMTDGMEIEVSPSKKEELLIHIFGDNR